jgi:hypothetical protein
MSGGQGPAARVSLKRSNSASSAPVLESPALVLTPLVPVALVSVALVLVSGPVVAVLVGVVARARSSVSLALGASRRARVARLRRLRRAGVARALGLAVAATAADRERAQKPMDKSKLHGGHA